MLSIENTKKKFLNVSSRVLKISAGVLLTSSRANSFWTSNQEFKACQNHKLKILNKENPKSTRDQQLLLLSQDLTAKQGRVSISGFRHHMVNKVLMIGLILPVLQEIWGDRQFRRHLKDLGIRSRESPHNSSYRMSRLSLMTLQIVVALQRHQSKIQIAGKTCSRWVCWAGGKRLIKEVILWALKNSRMLQQKILVNQVWHLKKSYFQDIHLVKLL